MIARRGTSNALGAASPKSKTPDAMRPGFCIPQRNSDVVLVVQIPIRVRLRLADLPLRLALQLLRLPHELLTRITSQPTHGIPDLSLCFLPETFRLVLEAV